MTGRLIRLALLLLLAGLLTPFLADFIRDVLLLPLLYAAWLARLLLESIPQVAFWIFFVFIALLLTGQSLFQKGTARADRAAVSSRQVGRIESWAALIRRADREHYARWRLARELRKLLLAMLAAEERKTLAEIRQDLEDESLDLPPDIRAYLKASMVSFSHFAPTRVLFWTRAPRSSPLDLAPDRIVQFLEEHRDS